MQTVFKMLEIHKTCGPHCLGRIIGLLHIDLHRRTESRALSYYQKASWNER